MVIDPSRRRRILLILILSLAGAILLIGWKAFWFLTDDAYISFRYVSNSMLGHGYVWNPPPFRPVEGYTNFLHILILDGLWRAFGVTPPAASNYVSLVFSFLTLVVAASMLLAVRLGERMKPYRLLLLGLVLVGITTNRTYLTWSSSGLETAMFSFFLFLWLYFCVRKPHSGRWFVLSVSSSAVGIYLTRPDGGLFLAATAAILLLTYRRGMLRLGDWPGSLPLLLAPAHLAWRRLTYGEWLPNSYYAKFTSPWPGSGARYALSFVMEYGLWIYIALLAYFLYRSLRSHRASRRSRSATGDGAISERRSGVRQPVPYIKGIVVAAIAIHALYYTFIIGGDHFEYRIYSHFIPLAFVSFAYMLGRLNMRPIYSVVLLVIFILMSWPMQWTHWALTRNLTTREETHTLFVRVSDHWPRALRWYASVFDGQQEWLTQHYVCTRHQEHKINCEFLKTVFPTREEGSRLPKSGYPVFVFGAVGVVSWVLPEINIIDGHGINDYVIARSPVGPGTFRMMGHDRLAPEGYVECFRPNVEIVGPKQVVVRRRERPLTAEEIVECEGRWAARIRLPE